MTRVDSLDEFNDLPLELLGKLGAVRIRVEAGGARRQGVGEDVEDVVEILENDGVLGPDEGKERFELGKGRGVSGAFGTEDGSGTVLTVFSDSAKSRFNGSA